MGAAKSFLSNESLVRSSIPARYLAHVWAVHDCHTCSDLVGTLLKAFQLVTCCHCACCYRLKFTTPLVIHQLFQHLSSWHSSWFCTVWLHIHSFDNLEADPQNCIDKLHIFPLQLHSLSAAARLSCTDTSPVKCTKTACNWYLLTWFQITRCPAEQATSWAITEDLSQARPCWRASYLLLLLEHVHGLWHLDWSTACHHLHAPHTLQISAHQEQHLQIRKRKVYAVMRHGGSLCTMR